MGGKSAGRCDVLGSGGKIQGYPWLSLLLQCRFPAGHPSASAGSQLQPRCRLCGVHVGRRRGKVSEGPAKGMGCCIPGTMLAGMP